MSTSDRVSRDFALTAARAAIRAWLHDPMWNQGQHDVWIVGSVRRGRDPVGDIEIVAPMPPAPAKGKDYDEAADKFFRAVNRTMSTPWIEPGAALFTREGAQVDVPIGTISSGLRPGFRAACLQLHIGAKARLPCQIYRFTPENRGWLMLMRTGPADFGRWFLGKWKQRHDIPVATKGKHASQDGYLVDARGIVVPVETEDEAFRKAGVEYIPPHQRDAFMDSLERDRKFDRREMMR